MPILKRENNPNWKGGRISNGLGYSMDLCPEHPRSDTKGYVLTSVLVAEKALGKKLPKAAVVHHVNGKTQDNNNSNLVVCQDQSYHLLLHRRMIALKESGHPNWLKCTFCKAWDDANNIIGRTKNNAPHHKSCATNYHRKRRNGR